VNELLAILVLLAGIFAVLRRLPRVDLGHSQAFLRRRFWNWFPLGLTYAFLYMGRYNLTVAKNELGELMTKEQFGTIFSVGTLVYGISFVVNGPLTDRFGGRATILVSAAGSALANLAMGLVLLLEPDRVTVSLVATLYAANMYFQSFGAVAIVKVNAAWFHVRERGTFSGIFGILISLGIYFAFDWNAKIIEAAREVAGPGAGVGPVAWAFLVPAAVLALFFAIELFLVRDHPSGAGLADLDTEEGSIAAPGERKRVWDVVLLMLRSPVIRTIALIEFCSGYLRQGVMQWTTIFAKETGVRGQFVHANWGIMLCLAGILGGVLAGTVSDRVFRSRRGPSAAILFAGLVAGCALMIPLLATPALGPIAVLLSLCVIGVHGMLSGTASMDFAGRRNTGLAVGLIDGMVYLGTAAQAILLGRILPSGEAQRDASNWSAWPMAVLPVAVLGFLLCLRIWHARPARAGQA
jgi:OPA family glycerol-3-phosphate transporter-like MFS transporter